MKTEALMEDDEEPGFSLDVQINIESADWHQTFPYIETLTAEVLSEAFLACKPESLRGRQVEVSVCFDSDSAVEKLNTEFRGKNTATNVLSFPSYENLSEVLWQADGQPILIGDIVLAYGVVQREAAQQHKSVDHHLMHLLVHGLLHLLGYDHVAEEEALVMERKEAGILKALGVSDPYANYSTGEEKQ